MTQNVVASISNIFFGNALGMFLKYGSIRLMLKGLSALFPICNKFSDIYCRNILLFSRFGVFVSGTLNGVL